MQHILKDIIKYTHGLGEFDAFKIMVKHDGRAMVKSTSKGMDLILSGRLKENIPLLCKKDQDETFTNSVGFLNLDVLSGYLNSPFFGSENSSIAVVHREGDGEVRDIIFTSPEGHRCSYRTLDSHIAQARIRSFKMVQSPESTFEFTPTEAFLKDFRGIAGILGKFSDNFFFSTENGMLMLNIEGDDNSAKIPVIECDVIISTQNHFPIKQVLAILRQAPSMESITIKINDDNSALDIDVDTDVALYNFALNAN